VPVRKPCPHDGSIAERGPNASQRPIGRIEVAPRSLGDKSELFRRRRDAARRQLNLDHPSGKFGRLEPQPDQIDDLHCIERWGGGTDTLFAPSFPVEQEANREDSECLPSDDECQEQRMEEPLHEEE
jgi:hypothetical protein